MHKLYEGKNLAKRVGLLLCVPLKSESLYQDVHARDLAFFNANDIETFCEFTHIDFKRVEH